MSQRGQIVAARRERKSTPPAASGGMPPSMSAVYEAAIRWCAADRQVRRGKPKERVKGLLLRRVALRRLRKAGRGVTG